ncbi:MAG: hemolysin family protein [Magnetospiraceae bacterium]
MSDGDVGNGDVGKRSSESLVDLLLEWMRGTRRKDEDDSVREAIEELIETRNGDDNEVVQEEERNLLANILRLRDRTAEDVMIPSVDIVAVEIGTSLPDIVATMTDVGHSRLPVYRDNMDDVVGMVHIKDIAKHISDPGPFEIDDVLRDVLFVSPAMRVLELLLVMRTGPHLAVVVDEFGGTDGLVTIEDLVEEIVGEIEDEHDRDEEPRMVQRADGTYDVSARVEIEALEEVLGPLLDDDQREDVDTVGGMVFLLAGRVPARGEVVTHPTGAEFVVLEGDSRRIRLLRATPAAEGSADG